MLCRVYETPHPFNARDMQTAAVWPIGGGRAAGTSLVAKSISRRVSVSPHDSSTGRAEIPSSGDLPRARRYGPLSDRFVNITTSSASAAVAVPYQQQHDHSSTVHQPWRGLSSISVRTPTSLLAQDRLPLQRLIRASPLQRRKCRSSVRPVDERDRRDARRRREGVRRA